MMRFLGFEFHQRDIYLHKLISLQLIAVYRLKKLVYIMGIMRICVFKLFLASCFTWTTAIDSWPLKVKPLDVPPLQEAADILNEKLKSNFAEVQVEVVDCPDLRKEPFYLAAQGLGGNPAIVDIGGNSFLVPVPRKDKIYDLKDVAKVVKSDPSLLIGAGAGPFLYVGQMSEGIFNIKIENGTVAEQRSVVAKIDKNDGKPVQQALPSNETTIAILANLFVSEGKPGKVIKVHVKRRIGEEGDFIQSLRKIFESDYKNKNVGVGGVFLLKEGMANFHVGSDFLDTPIETEAQYNNWLKFFNMSAPIVSVGTFVNSDMGIDLKSQHFHSFSNHGEAGHYHYDITPELVEYEGYFNFGTEVYRIDQVTNKMIWEK